MGTSNRRLKFLPRAVFSVAALMAAQSANSQDHAAGGGDPAHMLKRTYTSPLDGASIDYALWVPSAYDKSKRWPLVVFLHGSAEGSSWLAPTDARASVPVHEISPELGFLVVFPLMRGSWSVTTLAERDVLDTIRDVQSDFSVDPDRIHLTGLSLGGFACWRIAALHPDLFATASPFCGGGDPDWAVNLRHVKLWATHGGADRNVSVFESDRMIQALRDADVPVQYDKFPTLGHVCWRDAYRGRELYQWMAGVSREKAPARISFRTRTLRHAQAYWATIESMIDPGKTAYIDIFVPGEGQVLVHAENVGTLTLNPPESVVDATKEPTFLLDGKRVASKRADQGWRIDLVDGNERGGSLRKRPGVSGPLQDVYYDPFIVVIPDTEAPPDENLWLKVAAESLGWTKRLVYNNISIIKDSDVNEALMKRGNLICFGDVDNNKLLAQAGDRLPLKWSQGRLWVQGKPARADIAAFVMIYPNPMAPDRYLVVCCGKPRATAQLAATVLQPPFLGDVPLEDIAVITDDGKFPLAPPAPDKPRRDRSMADPPPQRGALFDSHWRLTDPAIQALIGVPLTGP